MDKGGEPSRTRFSWHDTSYFKAIENKASLPSMKHGSLESAVAEVNYVDSSTQNPERGEGNNDLKQCQKYQETL